MTNKALKLEELIAEMPQYSYEYIKGLNVQESSKITYTHELKYFFRYVSEQLNKVLYDISTEDIDDKAIIDAYIAEISNGETSQATYINKIKPVRMLYDYLYDRNYIRGKYTFPNTNKHLNSKSYGEDEYYRLIDIADEIFNNLDEVVAGRNIIRDQLLFVLVYEMGLKTSECSKLKIEDINLNKKDIRLNRENETHLRMTEKCYELANAYYEERLQHGITTQMPFFINQQNSRLGVRSIEVIIKNITKGHCGNLTPAVLRLLCGARLCKRKGGLKYVAQYLGIGYETALDHYGCINRGVAKKGDKNDENDTKIVMYL